MGGHGDSGGGSARGAGRGHGVPEPAQVPPVVLERTPPGPDDVGTLRCQVCGDTWPTTPEQDAILDVILNHHARHREADRGP